MPSVSDWFEASWSRAAWAPDSAAAQAGSGDRELRSGVAELFLADRAGGDQRGAPRDVVFGAQHVAARARQVGLASVDLRLQRAVVDEQDARLAHRLRQLRLGLVERDAGVGRIELDQQLAGLDEVGVVGGDRDARCRPTCGVSCTTLPCT